MSEETREALKGLSFFYTKSLWHNLTFFCKFGIIFFVFIFTKSINSEYHADSITKPKEFLLSKISMIIILSSVATFLVMLAGIFSKAIFHGIDSLGFIFVNIKYLFVYFIFNIVFLLFSFLIVILFKERYKAIIVIFIYPVIDFMFSLLIYYLTPVKYLASFLPVRGVGNLISNPFTGNFKLTNINTLDTTSIFVSIFYSLLYIYLIHLMLSKNTLK